MGTSGSADDPYYITDKGVRLEQDTYWMVELPDKEPWPFRFVEINDGPGGLHAVIQDHVSYLPLSLHFFDHVNVRRITDPEEIAMVMLTVHG